MVDQDVDASPAVEQPPDGRGDRLGRREALLDAALECFTRHGVLATGIEEIRRQAGASPSSVYHHFDGLSGLTTALLVRTFERATEDMKRRVLATTTARAAVHAFVDSYLEWGAGPPGRGALHVPGDGARARPGPRGPARHQGRVATPLFEHLGPGWMLDTLPELAWPSVSRG